MVWPASRRSKSFMTNGTDPQGGLEPKAVYGQLCGDFRSLNGFLWQTPLIFTTLTGGLWFAVASLDLTHDARVWILRFAAVANILMIVALYRLRSVMQRILVKIASYDNRPIGRRNYIIVTCFAALLAVAALGSWMASLDPNAWFSSAPSAKGGK